ncbi:MAG: Gfo/Idh/MocA family oxidoreductase, partial [Mailhella sp.]|nr:Gfo/Idh/MocA family oxidoreductase [Mailhella sp.]
MSDSPFRVGLVGCGRISGVHAQALLHQEKACLAALCDIRPDASAALAATCGGLPCYDDFADMIRRERLDAVHLCLPHHLHAPV